MLANLTFVFKDATNRVFRCVKRVGMTSRFGFTFPAGGSVPVLFISMTEDNAYKQMAPRVKIAQSERGEVKLR